MRVAESTEFRKRRPEEERQKQRVENCTHIGSDCAAGLSGETSQFRSEIPLGFELTLPVVWISANFLTEEVLDL